MKTGTVAQFMREIGPLRTLLVITVLFLLALAPFSGEGVYHSGWGLFLGAAVPALAVIVAFVVPLDIMMSGVFMLDMEGESRRRYKKIIVVETMLLVIFLFVWVPVIAWRLGYFLT